MNRASDERPASDSDSPTIDSGHTARSDTAATVFVPAEESVPDRPVEAGLLGV